jgi:spoIIIJ-associated protein
VAEIERSAASVEEAIEAALHELGVSEQEAVIQIVQEPKSGFLGIKAQPAIVRVRPLTTTATVDEDEVSAQSELVADFVEGLVNEMRIDVEVDIGTDHGVTYVDVWGCRRRGRRRLADRQTRPHPGCAPGAGQISRPAERPVSGASSSWTSRTTESDAVAAGPAAREAARKVQRSGRPESLPPMSAYERKLVHDTVAELGGLETASEGEEPGRYVVIRHAPDLDLSRVTLDVRVMFHVKPPGC